MRGERARRDIRARPHEWCHLLLVLFIFLLINIATDIISMEQNHILSSDLLTLGLIRGRHVERRFQDRKNYAQRALDIMLTQYKVFDTAVTSNASVLERGFPVRWDPCTIPGIFRRIDTHGSGPLKMVFLGGSSTARAADNCTLPHNKEDPLEGRFTNILQHYFESDSFLLVSDHKEAGMDIELSNQAQGGVGSMDSGLTLDTTVDPLNAHVLVYEFFTDDNADMVVGFELWLVRVKSLFERKGQRVPPIMLLFLWDESMTKKHILEHGLDVALNAARDAIDHYKEQGWNIQVVSVGSTFNKLMTIANNPSLIADDDEQYYYPNCFSADHIANMIRYAIHSDIASCQIIHRQRHTNSHMVLRSSTTAAHDEWRDQLLSIFDAEPKAKNLLDFLLRDDIRVASWTPWVPSVGLTDLNIGNVREIQNYPITSPSKEKATRVEHRKGYPIPFCSHGDIHFVLQEPELEWLGVGIIPSSRGVSTRSTIEWKVNGLSTGDNLFDFEQSSLLSTTIKYVTKWIRVPASIPSGRSAKEYNVSFCNLDLDDSTFIQLQQLVGVMRPVMTEWEIGLVELLDYSKSE